MFPNLRAEMARYNIKTKDVAELLDVTPKTMSTKMNSNKGEFTRTEMYKIKTQFFSEFTLDYLFSDKPIINKN